MRRLEKEIGSVPDIQLGSNITADDPFEACIVRTTTPADVEPMSPTFGLRELPAQENVERDTREVVPEEQMQPSTSQSQDPIPSYEVPRRQASPESTNISTSSGENSDESTSYHPVPLTQVKKKKRQSKNIKGTQPAAVESQTVIPPSQPSEQPRLSKHQSVDRPVEKKDKSTVFRTVDIGKYKVKKKTKVDQPLHTYVPTPIASAAGHSTEIPATQVLQVTRQDERCVIQKTGRETSTPVETRTSIIPPPASTTSTMEPWEIRPMKIREDRGVRPEIPLDPVTSKKLKAYRGPGY